MPAFVPNEYLFERHADKGNDRWEIYAWAVRDIMSTAGQLEKSEQPYRDKLHYESILGFRKEKEEGKPEKEPLLINQEENHYVAH